MLVCAVDSFWYAGEVISVIGVPAATPIVVPCGWVVTPNVHVRTRAPLPSSA